MMPKTRMTTRGSVPIRSVFGLVTLLASHFLATDAAAAQSVDVSGTWTATWASAVRHERDGSITVQKRAPAVLTLEQSGDSLTGTWTTEVISPITWRVTGTAAAGGLRLVATEVVEGERPDDDGIRVVRQEWTARIRDGEMEGEHWLVIELPNGEERRSGPRPWSARGPGRP